MSFDSFEAIKQAEQWKREIIGGLHSNEKLFLVWFGLVYLEL